MQTMKAENRLTYNLAHKTWVEGMMKLKQHEALLFIRMPTPRYVSLMVK